ncbi:MAG: type II toxin-antitoxin system PemK/MazF family toxin [Bacteroidetes bacterium]|nr:type II toxin-antitoxin system PemK/MazF family toxin [Bacteroidota bacterium]
MKIRKFFVYTADLNPRFGTEPGKVRPVVVIQTNSLNLVHPSTIVCPISTQVNPQSDLLRVHLKKNEAGLSRPSDVLVDQIRAIDNRRFVKELGEISEKNKLHLLKNLNIVIME